MTRLFWLIVGLSSLGIIFLTLVLWLLWKLVGSGTMDD